MIETHGAPCYGFLADMTAPMITFGNGKRINTLNHRTVPFLRSAADLRRDMVGTHLAPECFDLRLMSFAIQFFIGLSSLCILSFPIVGTPFYGFFMCLILKLLRVADMVLMRFTPSPPIGLCLCFMAFAVRTLIGLYPVFMALAVRALSGA